jgi:ureidoglycolate hydrolase
MECRHIPCEKASSNSFEPYGQYISASLRDPDTSNQEMQFWNKLAVMDHKGNTSVSIVQTYGKNGLEEHTLERHAHTSEVLVPTGDIVVVAALSRSDDAARPDLDTVKAFSVEKGSAIRFRKGVWHHAPLTREEQVNTFVLFYENTPEEDFLAYELDEEYGLYFTVDL